MAAGYSGRPLVAKLDLRPGARGLLVGVPGGYEASLGRLPEGARLSRSARGEVDFVQIFARRRADLEKRMPDLAKRLAQGGMIWVSWPKKASGVETDLVEDAVREVGLGLGLVDTKVGAVDETWAGLKFQRRRASSKKRTTQKARTASSRSGPGIKMEVPAELLRAVKARKAAWAAFLRMPPSHQRRYVEHVMEAKRPETRRKRIARAVEMMEAWGRDRGA